MKRQSTLCKVSLFAVVFFLLSALSVKCQAQTTTVNSTGIVDSDSTTWANATLIFTFQPNPNYPNVKPTPLTYYTTANGSGVFSVAIPDNNLVAAGSTYQITVCSYTSAQCSVLPPLLITGSTQNLTTYINSGIVAPRFGANLYGAYGYADVEVTPTPVAGMGYYNVITPVYRIWSGSAWTSGAGGGVTSFISRTGSVVAVNTDYAAFYLALDGSNTMTGSINETNPAAGTANLINVGGNAGNWASFLVQQVSNNLVFSGSNQFSGGAKAYASESPSAQHGLTSSNGVGWRYGLGFSCAAGNPNSACSSGYFQYVSANVLNLSNGIAGTGAMTLNVVGNVNASTDFGSPEHLVTGPTFSVAGCGTSTALVGGSTAGKFVAGSATCTPVVTTTGITATNGFSCWMNDHTTTSVKFQETASTTGTATFTATGTLGATDTIDFGCLAY